MVSFHKVALGVLIGLFLACVFAAIFTDMYYYVELPNSPDVKAERTERMAVSHGSIRYGSRGELRWLRAVQQAFPMAAVFLGAAVVLGLKWGIFHIGPTGRSNQTPSNRTGPQ